MKKINFNVICVGAGGTGGNFLKEFARFMSFYNQPNISITLSIIDGDDIEEKNCERQPYIATDKYQNKAVTLGNAILDNFNIPESNVKMYANYIDSVENLMEIRCKAFSRGYSTTKDIVVLIGAVDNHRARQVMHQFFNKVDNIIYIDSANEFRVGEICIGIRLNKKQISPPRAHYYPKILKDKSKKASEKSCGEINISDPQHISTNLMAANLCLCSAINFINGTVEGGIIYFDSSLMFSRFDKYNDTCSKKMGGRE